MRYEIVIENKLNMKIFSYVFCIRMMKIETKKFERNLSSKNKENEKMNMKKYMKLNLFLYLIMH